MSGVLGVKVGMSSIYRPDGKKIAVTLVSTEGCTVIQAKAKEKNGYTAIQLGVGTKSPRKVSKALKSHFEKAKVKPLRWLKEFHVEKLDGYELGQAVSLDFLKPGDFVKVSGTTKGKGFTGVMKRYNFQGGPGGHGSRFHRRLGSIGNKTYPKRIFKGRPMHGRHGNWQRTVLNEVIDVLKDEQLLVLKGAVPGATRGLLEIRKI